MCSLEPGIVGTLAQAIVLSVVQCKHQFFFDRWNCSLGQYRMNTLKRGMNTLQIFLSLQSMRVLCPGVIVEP